MGGDAPVIDIQGVRHAYPGQGRGQTATLALADISLAVPDGQFVAVVGPSGSGKTTLLHLVAGFERPLAGTIVVNQKPVTGPGRDRVVVFQNPALYPWLTVADNIALGLRLRGHHGQDDARVARWVSWVGLDGFDRHRPYQLSGGMQQRVAIARALILEPPILLMDEPFGALDAQTRADMQELLLGLFDRTRPTVLFVTHDVEEAVLLADRVIVLSARPGRVALDLPVALPRPRRFEVTTEPAFQNVRRRILQVLRAGHRDDRS
jgi:NitT/TauT family transport system ATP-binding protein